MDRLLAGKRSFFVGQAHSAGSSVRSPVETRRFLKAVKECSPVSRKAGKRFDCVTSSSAHFRQGSVRWLSGRTSVFPESSMYSFGRHCLVLPLNKWMAPEIFANTIDRPNLSNSTLRGSKRAPAAQQMCLPARRSAPCHNSCISATN